MYFYSKGELGELPEAIEERACAQAGSRLSVLGLVLRNVETFSQLSLHINDIAEDMRTIALYKSQGSIEDIGQDYSPGSIEAMSLWGSCETRIGQLTVGLSETSIAVRTIPGAIIDPKPLEQRATWEVRLPLAISQAPTEEPQRLLEVRHANYAAYGQETVYAPDRLEENDEALTVRCVVKGIKVAATGLHKLRAQVIEEE